ncbi:MAG: carbohydrate-binding protein, partial [Chitinophagaceae bacterium]
MKIFSVIPLISSIALLSACGGGSDSSNTSSSAQSVSSSVSSETLSSAASSSLISQSSVSSESTSSTSSSSSSFDGVTITHEAENNFFSGGVSKTDSYVQNFVNIGARSIFTVNASSSAAHTVNLRFANAAESSKTLNVYVNGIFSLTTTLPPTGGNTTWATHAEQLTLRAGINTISYQYDAINSGNVNLDSIGVQGGAALATRGATLPYQEFEAEDGVTTGQISAADRTYKTVESESSGRKFVNLSTTGEYVEWTTTKEANALVVRYSIPDSINGDGASASLSLYVNDTKIKSLDLSSRYAWMYGDFPYNNNPTNLNAHRFYDESRFSGLLIPAGAKIRLQKDADDTAAYYKIDLIDVEKIEPAYTMPSNFISITDFGAIANDSIDDNAAIISAIASAKTNKKGVWIPEGKFILSGRPDISDVHIRGAGTWYTVLQGINGKGGFRGQGSNVTVAD